MNRLFQNSVAFVRPSRSLFPDPVGAGDVTLEEGETLILVRTLDGRLSRGPGRKFKPWIIIGRPTSYLTDSLGNVLTDAGGNPLI